MAYRIPSKKATCGPSQRRQLYSTACTCERRVYCQTQPNHYTRHEHPHPPHFAGSWWAGKAKCSRKALLTGSIQKHLHLQTLQAEPHACNTQQCNMSDTCTSTDMRKTNHQLRTYFPLRYTHACTSQHCEQSSNRTNHSSEHAQLLLAGNKVQRLQHDTELSRSSAHRRLHSTSFDGTQAVAPARALFSVSSTNRHSASQGCRAVESPAPSTEE